MSDWYILKGKTPVKVDMLEAAAWFETDREKKRRIGYDEINGQRVSTVFLGLDHGWGGGPPVLFETMIFDGPNDSWQDRYCTYEEAEAGHKKVCEKVRNGEKL